MKVLSDSLIFLFLAALVLLPANAALQAVSPTTDPANGFPLWYQDTNALRLSLCLDQNGFCVLPLAPEIFGVPPVVVFDPANAVAFPGNFPTVSFYWSAVARMDVGNPANRNTATMTLALEGTFDRVPPSTDPIPVDGRQSTFLLANLQVRGGAGTLAPNSIYTVTHPFGVFTFATDAQGIPIVTQGQVIRLEDPPALLALQFAALLPAPNTKIGPFLTSTGLPPGGILDPVTGNRYMGNPLALSTITPGPFGSNFTIVGPNAGGAGVNIVQQSLWNIAGKSASGTIPPVIISTSAVPPRIEAVRGTSILMANVTDDIGVAKVTMDLTQIGGPANATMVLGSGTQLSGTWQIAVNSTIAGNFTLPVNALDGVGNAAVPSSVALSVLPRAVVTATPASITAGNATNVTITVTQGGAPVGNVTVDLTGGVIPSPLTGITDATGSAIFSVNATGTGTINVTATDPAFLSPGIATITAAPAFIKGDANGNNVVDVADPLFCLQAVAGLRTLNAVQTSAADANGNGVVDVVDGLFIAQAVAGLRTL